MTIERRLAAIGSDMTRPMDIDFHVAAVDKASADAIARAAQELGYRTSVSKDHNSARWTCTCMREMVATHETVIGVQRELDDLSRPLGGYIDGWGTYGNGPQPPPRSKS